MQTLYRWAGVGTLVLCVQAEAATCRPRVMRSGVTACAVDLVADYGALCAPYTPRSAVCLESFAASLDDAAGYFATHRGGGDPPYLIFIPAAPNPYDFSAETGLNGSHMPVRGAIDVSRAGAPSAQERLYISGAGKDNTVLISNDRLIGIAGIASTHGPPVSHITIGSMTLTRPNDFPNTRYPHADDPAFYYRAYSFTQGRVVEAAVGTVTLDIAPGYPTPGQLYAQNMQDTYAPLMIGYMRAYTTQGSGPPDLKGIAWQRGASPANPELLQNDTANNATVTGVPSSRINSQVAWGIPGYPRPVAVPGGDGRTWKVPFSARWQHLAPPATFRPGALICLKSKSGGGAYKFDDGAVGGGSDIVFDNIRWMQKSRGVFRGGITGVQVLDSEILRSPPPIIGGVRGETPCLSSSGGGPQIGQNGTGNTWGNVVRNLTAIATGDDSVAFFQDIGGSTVKGVAYPASTVTASHIHDSFARTVLVDTTYLGNGGRAGTQCSSGFLWPGQGGNTWHECDGLADWRGTSNYLVQCPVTYQNYELYLGCPSR